MKKSRGSPRVARERVHLNATFLASENDQRAVYDAIAYGRRNPSVSPSKAARISGTSLSKIRRYAPQVLVKRRGRLRFKTTDHLRRRINMLTSKGLIIVTTLDSETASIIAAYWNAVRAYVRTGDYEPLEPFILRFVYAEEGKFEFLTHRPTLNKLARAGELFFQDLYASSGGF